MFKPMLASNTKINELRLPIMVSYKLEGVRGEFTPNGLFARSFKKFNNRSLELYFARLSSYCRDTGIYIEGEFYLHGMPFNDISSICRRAHHPDTDQLELYVFDFFDPADPKQEFASRIESIQAVVNHISVPQVKAIPQVHVGARSLVEEMYETALEDGYEGLVFKSPKGVYKFGRCSHREHKFLRIKPDNTYDGVVTEIVERMENLVESKRNHLGYMSKTQNKDMKGHTGMAAVAIVECPDFADDVRVVLSKNLTDDDRAEIWSNRESYIGKHLRFFGIPVPGMNQPRCPRFDCWRTDLD
jgi:DNA ligase-1